MKDKNDFKVIIPASLEKSKDGEWRVTGLASTENIDKQGEILKAAGMDVSHLENNRSFLNFEHKNSPENTVGVIDGCKKTSQGLVIAGRLFKNHTRAKAIHEIMSSLGESDKARCGLSVEGTINERDPKNPGIVSKSFIKNVAITFSPVNSDTHISLVKSLNASEIEFDTPPLTKENIEKALSIGAVSGESASGDFSGGSALQQENSDKKVKIVTSADKEKKKKKIKKKCSKKLKSQSKELYKTEINKVLDSLEELYPEHSRNDLWEVFKDRLNQKFFE